ncbi:MAG: hypothetical protein ACYC7E_18215 [Armatimonadota bacterium]
MSDQSTLSRLVACQPNIKQGLSEVLAFEAQRQGITETEVWASLEEDLDAWLQVSPTVRAVVARKMR